MQKVPIIARQWEEHNFTLKVGKNNLGTDSHDSFQDIFDNSANTLYT